MILLWNFYMYNAVIKKVSKMLHLKIYIQIKVCKLLSNIFTVYVNIWKHLVFNFII